MEKSEREDHMRMHTAAAETEVWLFVWMVKIVWTIAREGET